MEIVEKLLLPIICLLLASCTYFQGSNQEISEVYVKDFQTEDMDSCKPSDVDLNNNEAKIFFLKSRKVDYKVIHDNYNVAPCFIEGVLKSSGRICNWKIQASSIGNMECNGDVTYFVCDQCEDLFN
jgi:hypothetical protein